jgi:hypothetical protein
VCQDKGEKGSGWSPVKVGLHSSTGLRWVKGNRVSRLNPGTKSFKGGRGCLVGRVGHCEGEAKAGLARLAEGKMA